MSVNSKMTAIADAIREKTGETALLTLDQMPAAIASIKGGGVEINAITAPELPATVTDRQIVVITSTPAGTIYIDTDTPANPVEGDVWVVVGANSIGVDFSETFRNGLMAARQYSGGSWTDLNGYIGVSNNWVQFGVALPIPPAGTPLENWTWEQIIILANSNIDASKYFAIGDTKSLVLAKTVFAASETITVTIGAFKHNKIWGTETKAQIAFTFKTVLATNLDMNNNATNVGGWDDSLMRDVYMPDILKAFPSELQASDAIKTVEVLASKGSQSAEIIASGDRLRLHSVAELGGSDNYCAVGEGTTYDYYAAGNRAKIKNSGEASAYWTRSPITNTTSRFFFINSGGTVRNTTDANASFGVVCCFDI